MYSIGLIAALAAALGYTLATFFLKASLIKGATPARLNLWANIAMAIIVQPLWLLDDPNHLNAPWLLPVVVTLTFFLGQVFTFAALSSGDVSVATPVIGTKVLLVTLLNALFFGMEISVAWWVAATLASLAIAVIAGVIPKGGLNSLLLTAGYALAAALSFSLTDTLIQHWTDKHDPMALLPSMFGGVGLFSILYYLITDRRAFLMPKQQRKPLIVGAFLLGLQCALMFLSLTWTSDATATNVVYSMRSLLTVVAASTLGGLFGLAEARQPRHIMIARLCGAALLFISIALILFS